MAYNLLENILLEEILDDHINFGVILQGVNQLADNINIIPFERIEAVRNENYYEVVIPHYNLDDFKSHFRMSRGTFEVLMNQVIALRNNNQDRVPFEKKLLFTVWTLSKQESFKSVGDRFDLAPSTAHNIFIEMITLISSLRHTKIVWPNNNERQRISTVLQDKSGIPGVIGLIDGCHIPIKAPPHNSVDYYNRNNYHSVILQGVCNDRREFIDIFVGTPGRVHDARVFRMSPLYNLLTGEVPPLLTSEHLLGDAAYPLLPFLLKPYRDNGHLTNNQSHFNTVMSSVRTLIEHSFGILKGKFRRLKYLDMGIIDKVPVVISAACVLHNIIMKQEAPDNYEDFIDGIQDANDINMYDGMDLLENIDRNNVAERKRDYVASLL